MTEKIVSQIEFEAEQIDQLFASYTGLLERVRLHRPDLVEVTAVASVLHSFYNGLENIFLSIAKGIDQSVPEGSQWHRDLLTQMKEATPRRPAVLTAETAARLADYMGFRHYYRHSYSFQLEWDELEKLATPLTDTWPRVREELQGFVNKLRNERTSSEQL